MAVRLPKHHRVTAADDDNGAGKFLLGDAVVDDRVETLETGEVKSGGSKQRLRLARG
jgi:hypothetical protein